MKHLTQVSYIFCYVFAFLLMSAPVSAQVPDLTAGDARSDEEYWNLGPTGMTGWFYHEGSYTTQARQIEVISVDAGSPAEGILVAGDVILGADGTGAEPVAFSSDARKALGYAIADAEANSPAILKLLRWRAGITSTVSVELETLGAYSSTAPYNCPKSAAILEKGLDAVMASGGTDNFNFSLVALLAGNDPSNPDNTARMARAQQEAYELILTQDEIDLYTSGDVLTLSKVAWSVGFKMVALAEYYHATGDNAVYDSLRAYAIAYANGQSMFGTGGHQFAKQGEDGSVNGPYGIGYGVVNSANMQCFYGLVLARNAGINDQEVLDAIERATRFYGSYVDRGSIPYGEHQPGGGHESNGKMGIAALCFDQIGGYDYATEYYARMAGASADNRDTGHTGPYLNYLWAPLGANVGGEESLAAFFAAQSWHFDLSRNWDGTFTYNTYGQGGNSGEVDWSGANMQMYVTALLTYATPLRQTYTTGKNQDPTKWLSSAEVDEVEFAIDYDASTRTTNELLADLGAWSPPTRWKAASEIGLRTSEHASLLPTLHTMATDTAEPVPSRMGACFALGKIADDSSVPLMVGLLTDPENLVQWAASKVLPDFADAALMAEVDSLLAACDSMSRPLLPLYADDPIHLAHSNLVFALFGSGGAGNPRGILYNHDLVGIDRELLYPAIRAAAETPIGGARSAVSNVYSKLSRADMEAVAEAVVDGAMYEAPADRMFSGPVRVNGVVSLQTHNFSEGVPLSKKMVGELRGEAPNQQALQVLENYAGSSLSVRPDPKIEDFCRYLIASGSYSAEAQAILGAIAADQLPDEPTPLKGVSWVFSDKPELTLPENWTILRADSYDHVNGASVYTWRKVHGAGNVSFTPNGSGDAKETTVVLDGTPGEYLFEVTMSDPRGLTEVTETVSVTLYQSDGTLPANAAPTADSQSLTLTQGTSTGVILSGSDPEGGALVYSVTGQPQHGVLSGTAPNLVYTSDQGYTGGDSFTFQVMDTEGQVASASVNLTVEAASNVGVAVYEPFDYPVGAFDGANGGIEVGLDGAWNGDPSVDVVSGSLNFGTLSTSDNSLGNIDTNRSFGGSRPISATALAANGLLDDGATLWFSAVMGSAGSTFSDRLFLALANDQFNGGSSNFSINDDGAQLGSGVGFSLSGGNILATQFRNGSYGSHDSSHVYGSWSDANGVVLNQSARLVVGKITWGTTSDTIEVYLPYEDMLLPASPSSVLTVDVDQSTFDTLTFCLDKSPVMDEVRLGATYQSVTQGTVAMTADLTAPTPNPMSFELLPTPVDASSITMTATPAFDPLGVEYYFTCTAGGAADSGWQESRSYIATGLTPDVAYSFTVKARDKQPGLNETAASPIASATIPSQATVPETVGMAQAAAESEIIDHGLSVGAVTNATGYSLTVPAGHVLSQTPTGGSTAAYGSPVDLVISIGEDPALPDLAPADIVDDQAGGPVVANTLVTYTLTFSEDIDAATVDAGDFTNAGDATITVGAITETAAGVFTVEVTPTSTGLLRFAVAAGATISDSQGDALNTSTAIIDDTTIIVNLPDEAVPDVVGLDQATAESDIVAANLTVGTVNEIYDETVAAGLVISQNPTSGSSVPGQSAVDIVISLGPTPDTTAPVLATLDPFDGETNVEVYDDLTVYFDEYIFTGTGNLVIRNLNDSSETLIDVTDTTQVRISGAVMTIDPTSDLLPGTSYAVQIPQGAVSDGSGNLFAGINDDASWNFSTAVTSQETILFEEYFENPDVAAYSEGTTPVDWVGSGSDDGFNATLHGLTDKAGGDFNAADPNQQAYAFRAGNTGITTAEGALATIAEGVTYEVSFEVVRDDGQSAGTVFDARLIAFNPGADRSDARSASPGVQLMQFAGNATTDGSFSKVVFQYTVPAGDASIGMDLALRFKGSATSAIVDNVAVKAVNPDPADEVAPAVTSFEPEDNATSFPVRNNLLVHFDEDIFVAGGEIVLTNLSDNIETRIDLLDANQIIIDGSTLAINPSADLLLDRFYSVQIPAGGITDASGNGYVGINDDTSWSFATGEISDAVAPSIVSLDPADGSTEVSYRTNLAATFDENIVAGSGLITLKNLTDSTDVQIDISDETQVVVDGATVTIDPTNYLGEGKDYAVHFDAGAVLDLSGNPHAGNSDDTVWNFTTSANNPPSAIAFDPEDEGVAVGLSSNLRITFDEDVAIGSGSLTLRNLDAVSDVLIDIADASQVSVSGSVLTINPTADFAEGTSYAVLIDAGAITDLTGNAHGGISDEATWNFMTGVSAEGAVFFDDFEVASGSPDVDAVDSDGDTSKETGPKWVRATQSFGADRHGLVDETSGQFRDPSGEQAYAFRYGNAGITSIEGAIGSLTANKRYKVSFYVVVDGYNAGDLYNVELVSFAAGASRTDIDGNQSMILASDSGSYSGSRYQLVTFEYISDGVTDAAVQWDDVALRFQGNASSATIDDVQVAILELPDTLAPTLAAADITDNATGGIVPFGTPVTYTLTFSEDMDAVTVDAADFGNAGTAPITIGSITETVPGAFTVEVTPTDIGTLQLQVNAGSVLTDEAGNALDTSNAILDESTFTVEDPNNGIPSWNSNPVLEAGATEDLAYSSTLPDDVSDPDGDTLSFTKLSGPAWLTVASDGTLSGLPLQEDVGSNSFTVSVTDSVNIPVEVTVVIEVANANDVPVWLSDPVLEANAIELKSYSGNLADDASDADGDTLSFAKVGGPAWLTVSSDGTLSGIPQSADVGTNTFTVSVSDSIAPAVEVTLTIEVLTDETAPAVVTLDPADDSMGINPAASFTMTFDEDVVANTGNLVLRKLVDMTDVIIDIADTSQVAVVGNTVTIDPLNDLETTEDYAILVDPGAISDLKGNGFAGITTESGWNFQTSVSTVGAVFFEDFEVASGSPDVDAAGSAGNTSQQTGPQWVRADKSGFGADRHGVVDESSSQFTDPTGEQAYAFRYTNAGITTVEGAIGALSSGKTYTVTFYVVMDGYNAGDNYTAQLVTFASGASRKDADGNQSMILASATGAYIGTSYQLVTFEYTSDGVADSAVVGQDVALRFIGQTTSANVDNIQVAVSDTATGPSLTPADIVDDAAGGSVAPGTLVTYTLTFSEDIDSATVDASDFGNAGTAPVTIGSITEASAGVFTVEVTPTGTGSLQFQVNAGATIATPGGASLDTSTAIADELSLNVLNQFEAWAGTGSTPGNDSNGDGISDGLAWVLGASDPAVDATALAPTSDVNSDPNYLIFTYRRSDEAHNDANSSIAVIYGEDMLNWSPAVHDGTSIIITETDDYYGVGVDRVEVKINWDMMTQDKAFVRLQIDISM